MQVAVVDADDLGADLERARELVGIIDLDERLHSPIKGVVVQLGKTLVRKHCDDEEDGVGSVDASLVDLVRVEDKVLAKDRWAVREGVDGGADGAHVL